MNSEIKKPTPGKKKFASSSTKPGLTDCDSTVLLAKSIREHKETSVIAYGDNALVAEANEILSLVGRLRSTNQYSDVDALHESFIHKIRDYESKLLTRNATVDEIKRATHVLCCLVDEVVLNTNWGGHSSWSDSSLLSIFYGNTDGGEKFYTYLDENLQSNAVNYSLLELQYLCLSLGFEGQYRLDRDGYIKHRELRRSSLAMLRKKNSLEAEVSPNTLMNVENGTKSQSPLPLWVFASICSAMIVAIYMYLNHALNTASDNTFSSVINLVPKYEVIDNSALSTLVEPIEQHLSYYLATEIERGLLDVKALPDRVRITLKSNETFHSGSAELAEYMLPIVSKVGRSLDSIDGMIMVVGHTDDTPIFTNKYPSNWHLSLSRATSVAERLSYSSNLSNRIRPEGMGDAQPLAPNTNEENRAKNRRVEIDILISSNLQGSTNS